MDRFINLAILSRPGNWAKVFLMVLIAVFFFHQFHKLWTGNQQGTGQQSGA